jgi:hypothetical protein
MTSITGSPSFSFYNDLANKNKPIDPVNPVRPIDNVQSGSRNPLDHTAGDDAEYFSAETQEWQPTASDGKGSGGYANLGDPYREPIDFEIVAGPNGDWVQSNGNR